MSTPFPSALCHSPNLLLVILDVHVFVARLPAPKWTLYIVQFKMNRTLQLLWRAGLNSLIRLPGTVVCGQQSSGKSSVLEAICGLKIPSE